MSSTAERKLAAIMFTDIADFTALSAKDETTALELLDKQKLILNPIIEEFKGTLHKEIGDGRLFTFPTVTDAVNCSIKIQESTKDIENLNLRIGIHEGEITLKDGDVLGDDVNVASRIEPFAAIGGVAISGKVQQNISSLKEFQTEYIGKPKLKGVAQEVKVYCITSHSLPKTDLKKVSAKLEEEESQLNIFSITGGILTVIGICFWVAVGIFDISFGENKEIPSIGILMMENIGNKDDEFWARGITEDLIIKVADAGFIRVIPIQQIMNIDQSQNFEEIAKKLKVKYLLSSSIHKKEDEFDLRCLLVEASTGENIYAHKWSEAYDNASLVVVNLTKNIFKALDVESNLEKMEGLTTSVDAYEFYHRGKYKFKFRQNEEDLVIAEELLKKAVEIDDDLLEAKMTLSDVYDYLGNQNKEIKYLKEVLIQAEEKNNRRMMIDALFSMEAAYYFSSDTTGLLPYALKMIQNSQLSGNRLHEYRDLMFNGYFRQRIVENPDSAIVYFKGALKIAEKYLDKKDEIQPHYALANLYIDYYMMSLKKQKIVDDKQVLSHYQKVLSLSKEIDDNKLIFDVISDIARFYYLYVNNIELAIEYVKKLEIIASDLKDNKLLVRTYKFYYQYYMIMDEKDKARDYFLKYYDLQIKDSSLSLTPSRVNLINSAAYHFFTEINDYDNAKLYLSLYFKNELDNHNRYWSAYSSAINFNKSFGVLDSAIIYNDMAIEKMKKVKDINQGPYMFQMKGSTHLRIGQIEEAIKSFTTGLNKCKNNNNFVQYTTLVKSLVETYFKLGDLDSAKKIIDQSIANSKYKNKIDQLHSFDIFLARLYVLSGDYSSAIKYFKQYFKNQDPMYIYNMDYLFWAEAELEMNNIENAKEILYKDLNIENELKYSTNKSKSPYVNTQEVLWRLYEILVQVKDNKNAQFFLEAAINNINLVKKHTKDEEIKKIYMNRPVNIKIMDEWKKLN